MSDNTPNNQDPNKKPQKPKKRKSYKNTKYYINNAEFQEQIVECLENNELSKPIIDKFYLIARRAINNLSFRDPMDKEDCIQSAVLDLLRYWRGYKPEFNNPLAYYTQLCKNGYKKGWNEIHPQKYKGTLSIDSSQNNQNGEGGIYNI